ncbi:hypothetical protein QYE76_012714 [Lolium multiflorum]|uniref:Uncharacterized protein n=1 Tax=Lolium multiflorum TaxID=4521 RepID=A0AAD8X6J0_LOLMU|nr:hypothetical protein QYE76_012714 [Lolium multiflorum]
MMFQTPRRVVAKRMRCLSSSSSPSSTPWHPASEEESPCSSETNLAASLTPPEPMLLLDDMARSNLPCICSNQDSVGLGARLTGTLYSDRRSHVHLVFQALTAATASLVREMASGLVRTALARSPRAPPRREPARRA